MPLGLDFSAAEAYKAYVEEIREELFRRLFFGFKTAQIATPIEGVKGRMVLTELQVKENLVKRWSSTYAGTDNVKFDPLVLEVVTQKVENSVIPQLYEGSYLGHMRKKGQSSDDWPFEAFILDSIMKKVDEELDVAFWQGEAVASPADTDNLIQTIDGVLHVIADLITATTITPVATGAFTSSNAVANLRTMWAQVNTAYKDGGTDIFMSYDIYDNYRINYKTLFGTHPNEILISGTDYTGIKFELGGGKTNIIPIPGMGTSGRVVICSRENLYYGYDALEDWSNFDFEKNHRQLDYWMDFNFGVQIGMKRDGFLVVNDQT